MKNSEKIFGVIGLLLVLYLLFRKSTPYAGVTTGPTLSQADTSGGITTGPQLAGSDAPLTSGPSWFGGPISGEQLMQDANTPAS